MNLRRPLLFLALAIVLIFLVYLLERPERPRVNDASESYFIPEFDIDRISRVEVEQLLEGAELRRDGKDWQVAERITPARKELLDQEGRSATEPSWHRADHARVTSALGSFGGLGGGILVSDNPEKESLYQVDRGGVEVRGFDAAGKKLFDIIVGKSGPDFSSSYLRRADSANVSLVHRPLVGIFSPHASDWRDRKIWSLDPGEISKVAVTSPRESWQIVKGRDGVWKVAEPSEGKLDATKAAEIVGNLSQVQAVGFADAVDPAAAGLESPAMTLTITASKETSMVLTLGAKDDRGRTYSRLEGLADVFLVSKKFVDAIPLEAPK